MKVHAWRELCVLVYVDGHLPVAKDGYKSRMVCAFSYFKIIIIKMKTFVKSLYYSLITMAAFLLVFNFASCGPNDDDESQNEVQQEIMNKLAGTWELEKKGYDDVSTDDIIEITFSKYGTVSYIYVYSKPYYETEYHTITLTSTYEVSKKGKSLTIEKFQGVSWNKTFGIATLTRTTLNLDGKVYKKTAEGNDEENNNEEENNNDGDNDDSNNQGTTETSKMTVSKETCFSLTIKCEMGSGVEYYKFSFDGYTYSPKYKEDKEFTEDELRPWTEHKCVMTTYDRNDRVIQTIDKSFKTSKAPYTNYMCVKEPYTSGNPKFYQITRVDMKTNYIPGEYGSGSYDKLLYFYSDDKYLYVDYSVHTWETVNSNWSTGTYNIISGGNFYEYGAGSSFWGMSGLKGTMKISQSGSVKVFDLDLEDFNHNDSYIFAHCEASN